MTADAARSAGEDSSFHAWASGGAAVAGCLDLLVAVIAGLAEPPAGGGFSIRSLALPLAGASLLSFAACAGAWRGTSRTYAAVGVLHAALAGLGGFAGESLRGGFPVPLAACVAIHGLFAAMAMAAARAVRREPADALAPRMAGAAGAVAENLESVLVAIVFALVIRHFAVEAYKIPTTSMAPTLLGDDLPRRGGDRVLVKKWDAFLSGPRRWQIWVFRPPLDRPINYVKRVVGLPGETVEIRDGDLFLDGRIARKPPGTREDTWFPVFPPADGRPSRSPAPSPWEGEGFRREDEGDAYSTSGAKERRLLRYRLPIGDAPSNSGSNPVGDVRLRFAVEGAEAGTVLLVRIVGRAGPCEVRIPAGGGGGQAVVNGKEHPLSVDGEVRSCEVSFADLLLEARVDGEVVLSMDLEPAAGGRQSFGVSFGVEKGGAAFRDVRLDRDVFYTGSGAFTVPEGHYFFLGDNSSNSMDGRAWQAWETTEAATGRTFYSAERPSARTGRVEFRDRNGVLRSFDPAAVRISDARVPMSFVPAADLHGRAFAVFWPPRWFTTTPGGRLRILP